ncbi:MAG: hypothetical protein WC869_15815 [Phycisphaerae bacterium]
MNKLTTDFLRPFSPAQVMALHTQALHMRQFGMTADDAIAACEEYIENMIANAPPPPVNARAPGGGEAIPPPPSRLPECPECNSFMTISPVNVSRCTNIGGDWKSSLQCRNPDCRFSELSTKTLNEWRNK